MTTSTQRETPSLASLLLAPPLAALQFLTRIPVPTYPFSSKTLPRAAAFFPLVGTALGALAALLWRLLTPHLPQPIPAILIVTTLVLLTGALHEDALADCADAFGLRRTRDRTLAILHDSAIGAFGATALALSLLLRIAIIAALPPAHATAILIAALTLSRWAILPLTLLPSATPQASTIARRTTPTTLVLGTVFTLLIAAFTLHADAILPVLITVAVTAAAAFFFHRRLGGVTGDCFGATVQLTEIAVLLSCLWTASTAAAQTGMHSA